MSVQGIGVRLVCIVQTADRSREQNFQPKFETLLQRECDDHQMAAMSAKTDKAADKAMMELWKEWFQFYEKHFRGPGIAVSAADQMAFYEIAQPLMRSLAAKSE